MTHTQLKSGEAKRSQGFSGKIADALRNALIRLKRNDLAEAEKIYRWIVARQPDNFVALANLGVIGNIRGDVKTAIGYFQLALRHRKDHAESWRNLGNIYMRLKKPKKAESCLKSAVRHAPNFLDALFDLIVLQIELKDYDGALKHAKQAAFARPGHFLTEYLSGMVLFAKGDVIPAIVAFRAAILVKPDMFEAHAALGNAYMSMGKKREAASAYLSVLKYRPASYPAMLSLAWIFSEFRQYPQALKLFEWASHLAKEPAEVENGHMRLKMILCSWDGLEEMISRQRQAVRTSPQALLDPLSLIEAGAAPQEQRQCAENWVKNKFSGIIENSPGFDFSGRMKPVNKLRIGYLSSDFHEHATMHLISELFELHDRNSFEIYAYSTGGDDGSPARDRAMKACDVFEDVKNLGHAEIAGMIYRHGIDILVDLKGYTGNGRPEIAAMRPAPVQVSFLGYPGTMGADFIDYMVADPYLIPKKWEDCYREKIVYMPCSYQVNDRLRPLPETAPSRNETGLPDGGFVFCNLGRPGKIRPFLFDAWTSILKKVPESVLWLLGENEFAIANLKKEAENRGVSAERLTFAPLVPRQEHLSRLKCADLVLDTTPYNGHTTVSDALWVGVPVLTIGGEAFASRVAGSLLTSVDQSGMIASSVEEYENMAVQLAGKPELIDELKASLNSGRMCFPLFDTPGFTRGLELFYRRAFDVFLSASQPASVKVAEIIQEDDIRPALT